MFERFTDPARDVVKLAWQEARGLGHGFIGTEHLLIAMLTEQDGVAHRVLSDAGLDANRVRAEVERLVPSRKSLTEEDAAALRTIGIDLDAVIARIEEAFGPEALEPPPPARRGLFGRPQFRATRFTARSKKVLELSLREALRLGHHYIGTEHLLLGLIREGNGVAAKIITDSGVRLDDLRDATLAAVRGKAA
jgi:ATP-dependent Clp protease ATP-binding subunit ClpA